MMNTRRYINVVILLVFSSLMALAAEHYSFKHITMERGLSHNQVNNVYRDTDGFLWISTAWGLDRYDGYEMKVYLHSSDSCSIEDNYVEWVSDISADKMLVYCNSTINVLEKRYERFISLKSYLKEEFEKRGESVEDSLSWVNGISKAYVDKDKNIWMVCTNVCRVFSSTSGKLALLDKKLCGDEAYVTSIFQNGDDIVATTQDGKLVVLSYDGDKTLAVKEEIEMPTGAGRHKVFCDSEGDCWVTTSSRYGLWVYDMSEKKWEHCTNAPESYYRVPDFIPTGVAEDCYNRIWVTSDHGGLNIINKKTRKYKEIRSRKNDSRSLMTNSIRNIYCDNQGNVWIGEVRAGISMYNESTFKFDFDDLDMYNIDRTFVGQINAIEEDAHGNMWYATNESGLLLVSPNGQKTLFKHSEDETSLPNNIMVDITSDRSGNLWIGTFIGGLAKYDGTKFIRYKGMKNVPAAVSNQHIWAVAEDSDGNIWVGSLGKGVAVLDKKSGEWTEYNMSNSVMASDYISQICCGRDGRVYVATSRGVVMINHERGIVEQVGEYNEEDRGITHDIFVDSRGLLWIGSNSGLKVLNGTTYEEKAHFNTSTGLFNDVITSIVEDSDRNMWVTTTCGITNIIVNPNPRTDEYVFNTYNYSEQDGFLSGSVSVRSIKKKKNGEILVGGNSGVARFRPEDIKYYKATPGVKFTGLSVLGKAVKIGDTHNDHVVLDESILYKEGIELPYTDNMFTVSFSALSLILPGKVSYMYMLEGFNDNWISSTGHEVTYTNLAPGKYVLKVKSVNCDGFESDEISELKITILPPWWKTKLAYVMYAIIMCLLIWVIMRQVAMKEREKYRLHKVESDIQKKHEMDDMKMSFFTNVSHELRTPLSLIISPMENLMQTTTDEATKSKLEMMHRNAVKLLNMVNQLLDFRKADVNGMQLNVSNGDLVAFVKQCSDSFVALSDKNIKLSFKSERQSLYMSFDKDKMGKVVTNLLSNAFKFTPEGGSIETSIVVNEDVKKVSIRVADTGIGISDEHKSHVFDKFYQVPHANSSYSGSGIGLHMVKEFVVMHGGKVEVVDNKDKGSIFIVTLPLTEVETKDQMEEESDQEIENKLKEMESQRQKVVVVDDNADFRILLTDTLGDEFDVLPAKNGQEALELILKELPDLIISDVMMPVMDGNELCKRVKTDVRISHIPLIMLTAKTAEEHKIEGLSNGADDYLSKPFNPQILKLKVAKLVELGKKRQETFRTQIEPEPSEITITPLDEQLIQKAIKYVEDNMADSNLSVEEMSRNLGMSRVHLYKKMMTITGRSPIEFIRVIRLKRAAQMLRDKQQNISEVAYSVGFNNPKYFSKYFKDEFGVLPSVYQSNVADTNGEIDIEKL